MIGRIVYPVTREVVVLADETWLTRPSLKCYMRASNTGVYGELTSSLLSYIHSSLVIQNNLHAYLHSYTGVEQPSLNCFISSPVVWAAINCYMNSSDLFKGHDSQFCFLAAADSFFLTQAAYVGGLQGLESSQECYVAANEIIQFVQDCYVA
jgi:hypothetical protein